MSELDIPLSPKKYDVIVKYCVPCNYSERALTVAHSLVKNYQHIISKLVLSMGSKGVFEVRVGDDLLFSKKAENRLPEQGEVLERFKSHVGSHVQTYPQS